MQMNHPKQELLQNITYNQDDKDPYINMVKSKQ